MARLALRQLSGTQGASLWTAGFGLLATLAAVVQMALLSSIIGSAFLARRDLGQEAVPLALLPVTMLSRAGLLWLQDVVAQRGATRAKAALRRRLVAHLFALGPRYVAAERTGELVATAAEGVERLETYVARYAPQVVLSVVVPLVIAVVVWTQDAISAAILLITAPVIPLLMILVGSYAGGHIARQWDALSRLSAYLLETIQGLPTLVLFGRAAAQQENVARVSLGFRDRTMQVLRYAFLSGLVLEFMTSGAIALIAVELGTRLISGGVSFQRALFVLLLAPEFYRPLRDLGVHRHAAMEGNAAAERIAAILDTSADAPARARPAIPVTTTAQVASSPAPPRSRSGVAFPPRPLDLALTDLHYTYLGAGGPALERVSLTVPAGTRTAVVGPSGAGKSTLIGLLLRFLQPSPGQIAANGVDITELAPEDWRGLVALVPQRPHLFHGTIRDNILLGRPEASTGELVRAAESAGVAVFAERLPRGYDTPVGERGATLSGGEAQRIAIARAFLKDAPLLVLDEPTSSLDPAGDALIRDALDRLMHDRTTLVVAHRLNTVCTSDQIAVLDAGHLVELGDHRGLLARGGLYSRLVGGAEAPA
jgi:ATP-binding cassette, subfamily C, bacterial CydD